MKPFNLKKQAEAGNLKINEKKLQESNKDMNLSSDQQGVDKKNINLSIPKKENDNTVPFNVQLETARTNKPRETIIEADMSKKETAFNEEMDYVKPHDALIEKFDEEKFKVFATEEDRRESETVFWDKFVGSQLEEDGMPTKVKNNIPNEASQLQNNPERFKGQKIKDEAPDTVKEVVDNPDKYKARGITKMVASSLKDADAMLFHIYATAAKNKRDLTEDENQQIIDIVASKNRILMGESGVVDPIMRSLPYNGVSIGEDGTVSENGSKIDQFKSVEQAHENYPEGELPFKDGIPF